jgi:hypothetical protein
MILAKLATNSHSLSAAVESLSATTGQSLASIKPAASPTLTLSAGTVLKGARQNLLEPDVAWTINGTPKTATAIASPWKSAASLISHSSFSHVLQGLKDYAADNITKWVEQTASYEIGSADPNTFQLPGGNFAPLNPQLKDTLSRVVHDICNTWKPPEDFAGRLRAGVAFVLLGNGVPPDVATNICDDISQIAAGSTPTQLGLDLANIV